MSIIPFRPLPGCFLGLIGEGMWQERVIQAVAVQEDWLVERFEPDPRRMVPHAPASVQVFVFAGALDSSLWSPLVQEWLPCLRQLGRQVVFVGIESRWPGQGLGVEKLEQKVRRGGGLMLVVPPLMGPLEGPHVQRLELLLCLLTQGLGCLSAWS